MSIFKDSEAVVLTDKEKEKVLKRIYTMLCMAGDCEFVNKLVESTGNLVLKNLTDSSQKDLDVVDCGFIVATYSYADVEAILKGKDAECDDLAVTVCIIESDGSSAVSFNFTSGEVTLHEGTVDEFMSNSEGWILAW